MLHDILNPREWRPFQNGGRGDSLVLKHWVKATTDPEAGMSFFAVVNSCVTKGYQ